MGHFHMSSMFALLYTTLTTTTIMTSRTSCSRIARLSRKLSVCQPCRRFASASTSDHVNIIEMGPRDGLQNERNAIPLATKLELIDRLAQTGIRTIEAGSFVSPKWVPQVCTSHHQHWRPLTEYRWQTPQRYYKEYCRNHQKQSIP